MAYIEVNFASDIVYVAGRINGVETVFEKSKGKWAGYADAASDNLYHIWIEAYDEAGNRTEYETTVYYELPWFVTDRTEEDVRKRTKKGVLNAEDFNRIEKNIKTIGELVAVPAIVKTDWKTGNLPRASDWERIVVSLARIRNYAHRKTTPNVPERPVNHYKKVNDVEQILKDAFDIINANAKNKVYAGEIYAGEGGYL